MVRKNNFIKQTSYKNQNKVFRYILNQPIDKHGFNLYRPTDFESHFPFVKSVEALKTILIILQDKNLIKFDLDYSKHAAWIYSIKVLPEGYDFFHRLNKERFAFWLPLISSSALSVIAIVVSVLALLSKL